MLTLMEGVWAGMWLRFQVGSGELGQDFLVMGMAESCLSVRGLSPSFQHSNIEAIIESTVPSGCRTEVCEASERELELFGYKAGLSSVSN